MPTRQILFSFVCIGILCLSLRIIAGSVERDETGLSRAKVIAVSYTWQQNVVADWQLPSSWTPERTNPASSDILIFNTGGTTTATNVPTQIISQLLISGNTTVNVQSNDAVALTIAGDSGNDLIVQQNSSLNLNGSSALSIRLISGASALINGNMTFSSSGTAPHRLTAVDISSVVFGSGSIFTAGQGFIGNAFGTTNLNSVSFESGSTYVCIAGDDPFGAPEPNSVVVFQTGSLFSLRGEAQTSFSSGRTYANFELNYPGGEPYLLGTSALVMDDLTITAGRLHYWVSGAPGHSIRRNITVLPGAFLDFQSSSLETIINLNGNTPQIIDIRGGIGVNDGNTFAIDNPSGITISTLFIAWNLQLINGIVTVTNSSSDPFYRFQVPGSVSRVNGYVDGYLRRDVNINGIYTFDVGTTNGYSPVTVQVTAGHDFPLPMLVRAEQSAQPNVSDPLKALSRYWQVLASPDITSTNLTFGYCDPIDIPKTANEANFVIQRYRNGFTHALGVVDTQANNFSLTGVGDFFPVTEWTLAEPGAIFSPTPTSTPTATATPVAGNLSGTVTYGNAIGSPNPRFVSNVMLSGAGAVPVSVFSSFPNGTYSLSGFGSGAYTVTPSKTGGAGNAITSFDSALIAKHVAGIQPLTGNQFIVADVSGNGALSSFDAAQIARYTAGLSGFGSTANWIFTPANRNYASVTGNITGEDFIALLMGDVSGNWTNTAAR